MSSSAVAALVLAGGGARRMGGRDKLALHLQGLSVLDRVLLAATGAACPLVVVGPRRPTTIAGVQFVSERHPGGGPVPGVQAGLQHLRAAATVVVLAGDLPLLAPTDVWRLLDGLNGAPEFQAVAAADHRGCPNPLLAAYRAPLLRVTAKALDAGAAASRLLPPATGVVDLGQRATLNVNRPEDLRRAAALLDGACTMRSWPSG